MSVARPLRVATAGGAGDGKSTLIARLLSDLSLVNERLKAGSGESPGIEVVYRYFATGKRRFILADSPDHEHYAHNLASGAANADAMVVLVDVTKGLAAATRRHLEVARLLGIRQSVAFINKMDRVGYSQPALQSLDLDGLEAIPGSALHGDMVVERGAALDWYKGPTLLERLESFRAGSEQAAAGPLRFPVQLVSRPFAGQPRGYAGRIESGCVLAGTRVRVLPAGKQTVVHKILAHGAARDIAARRTLATVESVGPLGANEIGPARIALHAPLFVDSYDAVRATGALTVIDEATDQAVGAGLVR